MLLRHLINAVPWLPWLPIATLTGVIIWGMLELEPDFASRQLYFRAALLVAALGLCFCSDDPAAETSDPAPSALRRRRGLRMLLGALPWAFLIAVIVLSAARGTKLALIVDDDASKPFPVGRVLLEASTMAAWGLAIAAVIAKRWDREPGKFASATLLALYAASWGIPFRWKPWADPSDPRWATALPWWWMVFGLGLAVAVAFSWDSRVGWRWRRQRHASIESAIGGYSTTTSD